MSRPVVSRFAGLLVLSLVAAPLVGQSYHVARTFTLGGDGGWDYLALDTVSHRLFIARQDRLMVVNPETGALVGEIPGFARAHGIAFDEAHHRGFATSGADSAVRMFDLGSLAVLGKVPTDPDDDAILYDPGTGRIYTMNGDAGTASVIDPASGTRVGTIALGGRPEFAVAEGDGIIYANLVDKAEIAQIDARAMRVTRRWKLGPCQAPTGLALDLAHHRLFSGCRNGVMAVSDAAAGRFVTTVPIGRGVDGCRFDAAQDLAFASNGDGTLTVIREVTPDSFVVVASVPTRRGARTLELEPATHRVFTVSAEFGPRPAPTEEHPRPRPPILPGSFALLLVEP